MGDSDKDLKLSLDNSTTSPKSSKVAWMEDRSLRIKTKLTEFAKKTKEDPFYCLKTLTLKHVNIMLIALILVCILIIVS